MVGPIQVICYDPWQKAKRVGWTTWATC
jgi:hypothetical protein